MAFYKNAANRFLAKQIIEKFEKIGVPAPTDYNKLEDQKDIQINSRGDVVEWNKLTNAQQQEFLATMSKGVELLTDEEVLRYVILREGRFIEHFGKSINSDNSKDIIELIAENIKLQKEVYPLSSTQHKAVNKILVEEKLGTLQGNQLQISSQNSDIHSPINSIGSYTMPDGGKYYGELKDGKAHGRGIYTYPNGGKYDGEWKDGLQLSLIRI